jgi:hypothetical protein
LISDESNRLVVALREAAEAIAAAKVPAKLHEIAFAKSLDHLLGTPPQESQAADLRQTSERQQDSNQVDTLGRIAAKLKIGSAIAERVFAVDRSLSSRLRHLVVEFSVRPPLWAVC